jgi:hypothetical protein
MGHTLSENPSDATVAIQAPLHSSRPSPMLTAAVALFVVTRLGMLFVFEPPNSGEVRLYYAYASQGVDAHQTPYRDFPIEYPPLAWWTIAAPRVFQQCWSGGLPQAPEAWPGFAEYRSAWHWLMALADLVSFVTLLLIVHNRRPQLAAWAAFLYVVITAILAPLLYERLDTGLLMLLMLAGYAWTRSLKEPHRPLGWFIAAYALLGLSVGYKLIPLVGIPFVLLVEWHAPRRQMRLAAALLVLAVTIGLPFAIQYTVSGPGVFVLFPQHAARGIQLESLYTNLMLVGSLLGEPVFLSHSHAGYDVCGPLAPAMKTLSTIVLGGFLAGLLAYALLRGSHYRRQNAYLLSVYSIAGVVICSNVLSPQYLLWALPLLLLLAMEILPAAGARMSIAGALLIAVAAMTTWIFPYHYFATASSPHGLVPMDLQQPIVPYSMAFTVLAVRNLTYLAVIVWIGMALFRGWRTEGQVV